MSKHFENSDLLTLKVIAETLNRSNDLQDMLQSVLEKLLDVTGLTTGWVFMINEQPKFTLIASHHIPPALAWENQKPMCEGRCFCLNKYWDGKLNQPVNIIECKRLEDALKYDWGDTQGLTHHATVPLTAGGERFGILNVAAPNKTHFSDEELTLLQSVAYQIGTAVKRTMESAGLYRKKRELALIEERNRLARDLHDSVSQKLFSLSLTARGLKEHLSEEAGVVKESLDHMQEMSKEALREMRSLIWQLRPSGVEEGIMTGLKKYAEHLGLAVVGCVEGVYDLPRIAEEALWRIGQEAINNVRKHAQTDQIGMKLESSAGEITLEITDNGCGFDYNPEMPLGTLGLRGMKERAEMFAGILHIKSKKGDGTRITVTFPYKGRETDGN
ncbi:two-component system NarL family sensor kinase [Scopulibacillus darangshiensis]|uniref:histidine kinase n=1 Tax=Scopulibacillus darangshiensis TaxID=442528 RepID=A0A4R2NI30_9BACL|nr:GAF domain-containing sensor histidine kinase [Scopulibacillus darangshiensis]TCP21057.1 two-component system NarL family sensor kinase [Scopulibacillus darangshiensis]